MSSDKQMSFGEQLRQLRLRQNKTQSEVANDLGITNATVSNHEQLIQPTPKHIRMWARYYGVSTLEFERDYSSVPPKPPREIDTSLSLSRLTDYRDLHENFRSDIVLNNETASYTADLIGLQYNVDKGNNGFYFTSIYLVDNHERDHIDCDTFQEAYDCMVVAIEHDYRGAYDYIAHIHYKPYLEGDYEQWPLCVVDN